MTTPPIRLWRHIVPAVLLLALLLPALPMQTVSAGTHCVNPGGTAGCFASIQAAINDPGTVDGDTITVEPNNPVQLTYNQNVTVSKSLAIIGTDVSTTTLSGTGGGTTLTVNAGKTVTVSTMTISNGSPWIVINYGVLTLANDTIIGGLIANTDIGNLTMSHTTADVGTIANGAGMATLTASLTRQANITNGTGTLAISNSTLCGIGGYCPTPSGITRNLTNIVGLSNTAGIVNITSSSVNNMFVSNDGGGAMTLLNTSFSGFGVSNNSTGQVTVNGGPFSANVSNNGPGTVTVSNVAEIGIVYSRDGTITVTNCPLINGVNSSGPGTVTLTNSRITTRGAPYGPASGISNTGTGTVNVIRSTVDHSVVNKGGGIYNKGIVTVTGSTLDHNNATNSNAIDGGGGGIYNDTGGTATLINSTLYSNTTGGSIGGGILNLGTMKIINSTISGNNAPKGGGIANYATLNMSNTIVAWNTASGSGPDVFGAVTSGGHNLIGNTSGGSGFVGSDLQNVNPLLGPFAGNGGPTFTMALLPGSPAIGAGDPAICAAAPPNGAGGKDQRGLNRAPDTCSIGSYEVQPNALPPPKPTTLPFPVGTALPIPPIRPTAAPVNAPTPNPLPPARP